MAYLIALLCVTMQAHPEGAESANMAITVDPPTRVSAPGMGGHFFGFGNTQADPIDPRHLITCGMVQDPSANAWRGYLYTSHDGGRGWQVGMLESAQAPDGSAAFISEVSCAIGPDRRTYFAAGAWNPLYLIPRNGRGVFRLYRSDDAERTWSRPLTREWLDHSRSAVDVTGGPHRGQLYVFGNEPHWGGGELGSGRGYAGKPLLVLDNPAATLRGPVFPPADARYRANFPSQAVVLGDGTVLAVYGSSFGVSLQPDTLIEVVASRDGGHTLSAPAVVRHSGRIAGYQGTIAATPNTATKFHDRVYVAWLEHVAAQTGSERRIMLASSDDSGRSWSAPLPVSTTLGSEVRTASGGVSLAVNRSGVVGMTWAENSGRCWRFSASGDGGQTFSGSVPLNLCPGTVSTHGNPGSRFYRQHLLGGDRPFDPSRPGAALDRQFGFSVRVDDWSDVGSLAATADGVFHPTWSTKGSDGSVWSTRVMVGNSAEPTHSLEKDPLQLISGAIVAQVAATDYDDSTGQVTAEISLINAGTEPLRGPIVLEVTALASSFGAVTLVNSDEAGRDARALVRFPLNSTNAGVGGMLAPGARTQTRRLVFQVAGVREAEATDLPATPVLFSLTGEVYVPAK